MVIKMNTIAELTEYVATKAKSYCSETGEEIEVFPTSIVDFVIEFVCNGCHFPSTYNEQKVVEILEKGKNTLAMACVDIYSKSGAEGQVSHGEANINRSYDNSWISFNLLANFPNYAKVI